VVTPYLMPAYEHSSRPFKKGGSKLRSLFRQDRRAIPSFENLVPFARR